MKLFLASSLDKTIEQIAPQLPQAGKVLFIANAGDPSIDTWWITSDRQAFLRHGFTLTECDLRLQTPEQFSAQLADHDIVHVAGGSVFYLISLLRTRQLSQPLIDAVKSGRAIYTGTSAGSMIVAPTVWPCQFDEEDQHFLADMVSDFSGLNLVPFLIMPHCDSPEFAASNAAAMSATPKHQTPLLMLYDNQAVKIENDQLTLITAA